MLESEPRVFAHCFIRVIGEEGDVAIRLEKRLPMARDDYEQLALATNKEETEQERMIEVRMVLPTPDGPNVIYKDLQAGSGSTERLVRRLVAGGWVISVPHGFQPRSLR
jgi:hypothetical protein